MRKLDAQRTAQLYLSGQSLRQVARQLRAHVETVRRTLLACGIEPRAPGPHKTKWTAAYRQHAPKAGELYAAGSTLTEIAAHLGISYLTAWKAVTFSGVRKRAVGKHKGWVAKRAKLPPATPKAEPTEPMPTRPVELTDFLGDKIAAAEGGQGGC